MYYKILKDYYIILLGPSHRTALSNNAKTIYIGSKVKHKYTINTTGNKNILENYMGIFDTLSFF